jgi:Mce-associated membrane protein
MPPARRRRPVQPATRVRLPRSARSHPAADVQPDAGPDAGPVGQNGQDSQDAALRAGSVAADAGSDAAPAPGDTLTADTDTLSSETRTEAEPAEAAPTEDTEDRSTEAAPTEGRPGEDGPAGEPTDQPVTGRVRRRPLLLPACLGALAVILGGLAAWFGLAANNAGSGVDTQNIALINPAATRQVSHAIDAAVSTIFSYNYADVAKTRQAAQRLLTGQAIHQYDTLFRLVAQNAPKEKLVLTTTVTSSGVEMLVGDRARLLIFINQSDTSNTLHKTTAAGAMLSVTAVRQGGQWKISAINDFRGL